MLEDKKDDIFLSRWINNELTPEELREFESHPEYQHYAKILAGTDALALRSYNEESALESIKSHTSKKETNTSKPIIKLWPYFTAAASIAIIFGLFLFNSNQSHTTGYGEKIAVTLPDGSEMILNAKSTATYNTDDWKDKRSLKLNGEAYFKVKKGSTFTVETENGEVTVLGTQFNVVSQKDYFTVACFEGKVKVTTTSSEKILTPGLAFRTLNNQNIDNWSFNAYEPSWLNNTSTFRSTPIQHIITALENQYNITIQSGVKNQKISYTGTFPNDDLDVALKTVFSTLGLSYTLSKDGKTLVLSE